MRQTRPSRDLEEPRTGDRFQCLTVEEGEVADVSCLMVVTGDGFDATAGQETVSAEADEGG
jgi:hypothetical protein